VGFRDSILGLGRGVIGRAASAAVDWAEGPSSSSESLEKAAGAGRDEQAAGLPKEKDEDLPDPKAMFWDPFAVIEQLGYKERPTAISYGTLRAIFYKMPVISAIIQARINQVAAFAQPQRDRYDLGFRITMMNDDDKPRGPEKKWITNMQDLILHTGVWGDPRSRDNMERFLRKLTWDSLVYDQACFEIVPNRRGAPAQWYATDASSMRLADTATAYLKKTIRDDTQYVQIYDGMVVNEYTESELCFGVRNPRTDMRLYGYGTGELELLMSVVTSLLWGFGYNQKFFSQGSATKGILNFKGALPERQLKGFRRHWYNMLTSVENAWRTPITNSEGLEWIDLHANNRDMEYNAWMDFLIKVACSMFMMDPVEVNFKYGNVGQRSAMQDTHNSEKITESKERGLRPILRAITSWYNQHIIWPSDENFKLEFVGLDNKTADDVVKLHTQQVKSTRTVNELRAEDDMPPLKDGLGDLILDPTWMQAYQAQKQQEMGVVPGSPGLPGQESPPGAPGEESDGKEEDQFDFEALLQEQEDEDDDDEDDAKKPDRNLDRKKVSKSLDTDGRNGNRVVRFDLEL
jgi:hypothetical protein